ncbi:MAG: tetratricopeptide repeat protein, partial [Chitinophagaceae bacterium]
VIQRYGNTQVGNLSKYCAGVCYVRLGQYQQGINLLKEFDADDQVIQAMDYGIMGDAYMELGKTQRGIAYYKKAAYYRDNALISPFYLKRAGMALEKVGKNQDAIDIFKQIKDKYPQSLEGRDIDKYLAQLGDTQ